MTADGELASRLTAMTEVLGEVAVERERQEAKWGEQNHPNGTGPMTKLDAPPVSQDATDDFVVYADDLEKWARERCEWEHRQGTGAYEQILTKEWAEAVATLDPCLLRRELIQVAAVAVAWVEKIDRDAADPIQAAS